MIRAVNDRDARIGVAEMLAERQSTEARAQDDHMNLLVPFHAPNLKQPTESAMVRKVQSTVPGSHNGQPRARRRSRHPRHPRRRRTLFPPEERA